MHSFKITGILRLEGKQAPSGSVLLQKALDRFEFCHTVLSLPVPILSFYSDLSVCEGPDPMKDEPEAMLLPPLQKELKTLGESTKGLREVLRIRLRALRPSQYPITFIAKDPALRENVLELALLEDPSKALQLLHPQR